MFIYSALFQTKRNEKGFCSASKMLWNEERRDFKHYSLGYYNHVRRKLKLEKESSEKGIEYYNFQLLNVIRSKLARYIAEAAAHKQGSCETAVFWCDII